MALNLRTSARTGIVQAITQNVSEAGDTVTVERA